MAVTRLAVREIPRSGKPDELLDKFGISASHIVAAVQGDSGLIRPRMHRPSSRHHARRATAGRDLRSRSPVAAAVAALAAALHTSGHAQAPGGSQDPAWAPDGKHVAVSYLDRIWTMTPEGRQAKALTMANAPIDAAATNVTERDPAWSPDGTRIAFASTAATASTSDRRPRQGRRSQSR